MGKSWIVILIGIAMFLGSFFLPVLSPLSMIMMLVGFLLIIIIPAKKIKDWWRN